jgi:hypothetical protein
MTSFETCVRSRLLAGERLKGRVAVVTGCTRGRRGDQSQPCWQAGPGWGGPMG